MKFRKILVLGSLSATVAAGALLAPQAQAQTVTPASCLGSAHSYSKPSGPYEYPVSGDLTTTSNCNDININPNSDRYVEVCFENSGGVSCQNNYTLARKGQWTVIASDVLNGTKFFFEFETNVAANGSWAA